MKSEHFAFKLEWYERLYRYFINRDNLEAELLWDREIIREIPSGEFLNLSAKLDEMFGILFDQRG